MDASEFLDMSDRELLERFLQLHDQAELGNMKPSILTDGKVTASMIDIGHSINFLRVPLDNPNLCRCCGNYLPLLYFELSGSYCMKCLRAEIIRQYTSSTAGAGRFTARYAPQVTMMSDLDTRYRAQYPEADPTTCGC
ncbi:e10c851f-1dc8-4701-a88b-4b582102d4e3 [Sclerotinia trifoliorum]|uniref:E10c851f-1dc8-4701-a88b-4b582102d4e3 n=1 Tax=Sclerotinia trifoliorum TaxID=28548 RepID=A0A8H2VLF9_9HELO|nr:e10c851f-1dc8-4701-a88b-4b582102d4e3 [Sclerotinia trifoliorum]